MIHESEIPGDARRILCAPDPSPGGSRVQDDALTLGFFAFVRAGHPCFVDLLQQVGLFANDAGPQRLELEPASHVRSNLLPSDDGVRFVDLFRGAHSFGHQLGLAASFHGDEPPRGLVNCVPNGQQAMVAQNGCFPVAESFGDAFAFGSFVNNAGEATYSVAVEVQNQSKPCCVAEWIVRYYPSDIAT